MDVTVKVGDDGKLPPWAQALARSAIAAHSEVRIRIGPAARTTSANRYYWGFVIRPIAHAVLDAGIAMPPGFGSYDEWVHESMATKYLGLVTTASLDGVEVQRRRSTASLDRTEFDAYIERIRSDDIVVGMGVFVLGHDEYERLHGRIKGHVISEAIK